MNVKVRPLLPSEDRTGFRSGNVDLDRFFQRYAGQNQFRHHIGVTYVAVDDGSEAILGYATVTASELISTQLSKSQRKGLPSYPVPILRLARLAVDERVRGLGIGATLAGAVFRLAHRMAAEVGCVGVVVDSKSDAIEFYEKLGFIALEVNAGELGDRPQPLPMFIELGAISRD